MKVLIFNCGSSTLKFQVLALDEDTPYQSMHLGPYPS